MGQLQIVLGQDNVARKTAEQHIQKIKSGEPDKYSCYLTAVIVDASVGQDIKSLSAVILRRSLMQLLSKEASDDKRSLWEAMTPQAREYLRSNVLTYLRANIAAGLPKDLVHKICNLLVEVAGCMYELENSSVWQDLLNLVFEFVNSDQDLNVDASLQIFNGLFSYIIDHLNNHQEDLFGIF